MLMKKLMYSTNLILLLILVSVACSHSQTEPAHDQILRDIEALTHNVFMGEKALNDEKFQLTPLSIEDADIKISKRKNQLDAEITAFVGDANWISEAIHTITVHYEINATNQWEAIGVNINEPVIRVLPRAQ